jgi:hypothetical protein
MTRWCHGQSGLIVDASLFFDARMSQMPNTAAKGRIIHDGEPPLPQLLAIFYA